MEWRKDDAFGRTISTKQRSQLPPPRIYHLRLLSTPGRETFCVVWIEFGIWLVDYTLGPSNRPWSCLHIIRLIGLAHIPWPTCGILLKMWSTMHELAFGVQQEEITDLKWPPSPSYWGWGDVIFFLIKWSSLEECWPRRRRCSERHRWWSLQPIWTKVPWCSKCFEIGKWIFWVQSTPQYVSMIAWKLHTTEQRQGRTIGMLKLLPEMPDTYY